MNAKDSLDEVVHKAQESINCWGELLMATGGALNPEKCNWTVLDMVPKGDGTWDYRRCRPAPSTLEEGKELPGTYFPPMYEEGKEDPEDDQEGGLNTMVMTVPQTSGKEAALD